MKQFLLVNFILLPFFVLSQTIVSTSNVSGKWSKANSPYLVQTDITVKPTDTLKIEAGVEVIFQDFYGFSLQGHLIANGVLGDSIRFTVADTTGYYVNTHTGWFGIWDMDYTSKSADLSYVVIEYSKLDGLFFDGFDHFNISHSILRYNHGNGLFVANGNVYIDQSTAFKNSTDGFVLFSGNNNSDMTIKNFNTTKNGRYGLNLGQSSHADVSNGIVKNNQHMGIILAYEAYPHPIENILIEGNGKSTSLAGGIRTSGECEINNCVILNNTGQNGGGINASNSYISSVIVRNSIIAGNTATGNGGGIYHDNSGGLIVNNTVIRNNSAQSGGGIYMDLDNWNDPTLSGLNNLVIFSNNAESYGGGIYAYAMTSASLFINLSVESNTAGLQGGGLYCQPNYFYDTVTLINSILTGNNNDQISDETGMLKVQYSDIENGYPGIGNISDDPQFLNAGLYPMDLTETSPCINAGSPSFIPKMITDIAGRSRIYNDTADMGAYESCGNFGPSEQINTTILLGGMNAQPEVNVLFQNDLIPLNQPFAGAPWFYEGNESLDEIPGPDIIDWVLLEYRQAPEASLATDNTVVYRTVGFLRTDGVVVDTSGFRKPVITGTFDDSLYLVICHRNHNQIMTAQALKNDSNVYQLNIVDAPQLVYGGEKALLQNATGKWCLIPGNGFNDYQVDNQDKNEVWLQQNGQSGYLAGDFNLDGVVNTGDLEQVWRKAAGKGYPLPTYSPAVWNCGNVLTDERDDQTYNTVKIGDQCWMAENLNFGTKVGLNVNQSDNGITEKYCYNNDDSNCAMYGAIYQWGEVMNYTTQEGTQGICPEGWHIPTDFEWCLLENYADSDTIQCNSIGKRGTDAGGNLKAVSGLWNLPNEGATDQFGFNALPAGFYVKLLGQILGVGNFNFYFTSTSQQNKPYFRNLQYNNSKIRRSKITPELGQSLRCIKD